MADQRTPEDERPTEADGSPPPDVDVLTLPEHDPDRLPPLIRPAVDFIARIRATVHTKLLAGVPRDRRAALGDGRDEHPGDRPDERRRPTSSLRLQQLNTHSREAIYGVTAQSHYRAMALITQDRLLERQDRGRESERSRRTSTRSTAIGGPGVQASVDRMRAIDARFAEAGDGGPATLSRRGDIDRRLGPPHLGRARDLPRARGRAERAHRLVRTSRVDAASAGTRFPPPFPL